MSQIKKLTTWGCCTNFKLIMAIPFLKSFMQAKTRNAGFFAVGVAARGFYLVQVTLSGAMPKVIRCEYRETGSVTSAELEHLRKELALGTEVCTTLLAPGEYQIMMVDAPNVPVTELKTAIRWKIKDGLSYHIDDATVDVLQIPTHKYGSERAQSLYAIAAPNETIQKRIALFEYTKLELTVIDISETAQRNLAALFEEKDRALALLSFDETGGLLTFTAGGELYLSRRIEINVGQLRDANETLREQYRDRVELELQRSLDYFDRQFNHIAISRVLVSVPEDTQLLPFLAGSFGVPIDAMRLSEVVDISAVAALADDEFVMQVLPTLGAALRVETRVL